MYEVHELVICIDVVSIEVGNIRPHPVSGDAHDDRRNVDHVLVMDGQLGRRLISKILLCDGKDVNAADYEG